MERAEVIGRITKDPETRSAQSGNTFTLFSIAANSKDREGNKVTNYYDCIAYGQIGRYVSQFRKKGDGVYVTGKMSQRTYKDRNGENKFSVQINCDEVTGYGPQQEAPKQEVYAAPIVQSSYDDDEDSLPF